MIDLREFGFAKRVLLFLLLAVPVLHAQAPTAEALAEKIDRHYNTLSSLSVRFTQKYDGMGMHREESGVLLLKKPGKMRWTYSQPAGKLFVLDGQNAYFYSPGDHEVQRVAAKKLDDLRSPLSFLLGKTHLAKELNHLQMAPAGNGLFVLSGIPKNMENRISAFSVTVNAAGVIEAMKIEEVGGALNSFVFENEQANAPARDSDFVLHAPAGTVVMDGVPPV